VINLSIPQEAEDLKPRITVIGVGGAGGNAVNNMVRANLVGCEFTACNSDSQAVKNSLAGRKIQLGQTVTRGLGAGSRPDVGRAAAEEAMDEILESLQGSNMVFITAGMGGGTGTGAAPVIARAARESGILTVGVVTKPFHFEGTHRMRLAEAGIVELQKYVDTLIIIPNQNLFRVANEKTTFADAFKMADDVLHAGVRGVTDLMVMPGLINLDFADIRAVMSEMGKAMMGTGEAEGERRAIDAAEAAISNPLLEDVSMKGARGVLINITGGSDMTLFEVDEAANRIREEVDPEANIIFGSTFDENLNGKIRISVVATGIDSEAAREPKPTLTVVTGGKEAMPPAVAAAPQPALLREAATAAALAAETEAPVPAAAHAEQAALASGAFIAPKPIEPAVPRPIQVASPVATPDAATATPAKKRGLSLFERVTGVARAARTMPASQPERPAAAQPRLGAVDPADRLSVSKSDDELLDIPAFLRRQAN
jgi:cell division protein FtsZ